MTGHSLKRCATAVLCVLLMSLLAPAFAHEIVTAGDHFDPHARAAEHGHGEVDHDTHHHGHDLDEHDDLAHVLDHLSAKLIDLPSILIPGIAYFDFVEPASSVLHAAPSSLYRPPRRTFLA